MITRWIAKFGVNGKFDSFDGKPTKAQSPINCTQFVDRESYDDLEAKLKIVVDALKKYKGIGSNATAEVALEEIGE